MRWDEHFTTNAGPDRFPKANIKYIKKLNEMIFKQVTTHMNQQTWQEFVKANKDLSGRPLNFGNGKLSEAELNRIHGGRGTANPSFREMVNEPFDDRSGIEHLAASLGIPPHLVRGEPAPRSDPELDLVMRMVAERHDIRLSAPSSAGGGIIKAGFKRLRYFSSGTEEVEVTSPTLFAACSCRERARRRSIRLGMGSAEDLEYEGPLKVELACKVYGVRDGEHEVRYHAYAGQCPACLMIYWDVHLSLRKVTS